MEELELICKKEKDVIDNCDQIIIYCESYKKKATDLRESLQRIKHTHDFRKAYYKALHAITSLYSFTNEFMLELELSCPSEDEQDHELIEVPCLPTVDGESQNQQFEMVFLHGSSPWNFWLSHCDEKMTKKIKELLQKRENNLQELVGKPICGDYVLFKQGTHLQRAVVQKTLSSDRYQILDIDSGAIALIRQKRLYKMDEEISLIPCQAVNCFLIEDSEDSSLWTKELEEIFSSTLKRCKLTVKILDKKPGYPTSFFVNLEAEDIDDTELTVDVGKWVSRRIIPVLKSRSNLRVSALDAFFNEQFEEENDDECSDSSNYKTGDDSSQNQAPPVVESSNSVCSSDREDMVDTSNKESHVSGTNKIIPLEIIPLTKAAEDMFLRKEEVCAANEKKSSKIAAKFPANNNYPMYPPTSALMPMYPFIPISQNANSMREYPVFRLPPSGMMNTTNPMMGYPVIHNPPNAGPMMGYAINPRPPLTDSVRSYRVEPKPPNSALRISPTVPRPPSASSTNSKKTWSSHDFDSVIDKKYETPKFELKTPVVLVNPKDELRAMCSYVVSPYEFYVHLVNKNNAKIDLLEVDLEEFYSKCTNYNYSPDSRSKFCACKYIWNEAYSIPPLTTWFRAEIISFRGDQALVFLVDYGVTLNRNISDLRILDQRFYVYDKMAQRCHLHGMPVSRFSEDVCNYFKKIMQSMKDSLQLIIEANRNGFKSSLAVVIKHPQGDGYINDEIVEFIKSKEVNLFEQYDWDPMKEDFYADTNRLDHVVDNPLMATGGYIPKDEERLCKFFRETGRCPKKSCRQEHVYMGPDVFTVDRAETYANTFNKLKLPQEGSKLKVKVMTVISPTRFYGHWLYDNVVQKIPNKSGKHSGMYKYDLDDDDEEYYDDDDEEEEEETLVTLMNSLNAPRNTVNYKYLEGGLPSVGEMVIVKNIETDNLVVWYRARVSEVDEKYCVVFLIDFGVTLEVCTNFLRAMEPRFLHLPPQATEFCVAGVEAIDDRWSPDGQSTSILSQLENTCLYGYVLKRDLINHAVEVNLTNMNGDSIRSYLVDSGRYKLREMVVFGEDSSLLPG